MDSKVITKSDNVKPIAKKSNIKGKKTYSSTFIGNIVNPETIPERRKEYKAAGNIRFILVSELEFDTLRKSGAFTWLETIDITTVWLFDNYQDKLVLKEADDTLAKIYSLSYPSTKPGYSCATYYIFWDGRLYKSSSIEGANRVINAIKTKWVFEQERRIVWDIEHEERKAKAEQKKLIKPLKTTTNVR